MKQKVLDKATELFLSLGFKSVTMDDIAKQIGASKKTIYAHFNNKTTLVKEVTNSMFSTICDRVDKIHEEQKNPIIELFEVKKYIREYFKNEKTSTQYQLQKYYPVIFQEFKMKQFDYVQKCIQENLDRGLEQDLFRKNLNKEFISRIYFSGILASKDEELFPSKEFSQDTIMSEYLEYHLRGICTEKGLEILENQIKNEV